MKVDEFGMNARMDYDNLAKAVKDRNPTCLRKLGKPMKKWQEICRM